MTSLEQKARILNQYIDTLVEQFMVLHCHCLEKYGDLSLQELKVIDFLGKTGPSIMRKIADHLMLAVSTVTGIVDKMVQKEYVVRERTDEDRRIVKVTLTGKGQEIFDMNMDTHMEFSHGMLQGLNEDEQEILLVLLRKVDRNLQSKQTANIES